MANSPRSSQCQLPVAIARGGPRSPRSGPGSPRSRDLSPSAGRARPHTLRKTTEEYARPRSPRALGNAPYEAPVSPRSVRAAARSSSPRPVLGTKPAALGQRFAEIEASRLQCMRDGKYMEAQDLKHRGDMYKAECEKELLDAMIRSQQGHASDLSEAHAQQVQDFTDAWASRMEQYATHAAGMRQTLEDRLRTEHQEHMAKLRATVEPLTPRFSKLYFDMRRVEAQALRTGRYADASQAKEDADGMQEREQAEWAEKREARIATLEATFLEKQARERAALEKRIEAHTTNLAKTRSDEMQVMLARFQNVAAETALQQKIKANLVAANPRVHAPFELADPQLALEGAVGA